MRIAFDSVSGNIRLVPIVPVGMQGVYKKVKEEESKRIDMIEVSESANEELE